LLGSKATVAREALTYALQTPGKRFRALLTIAVADIYRKGDDPLVLDAGVAVECLHTASLILDDLPSMDDASLRRGQPPTHHVYGEGQAILAALSLIAEANHLVASFKGERKSLMRKKLACLQSMSSAISLEGLSGGQSDDLCEKKDLTLEELEYIHAKKTGALFLACVEVAAILGDAPASERDWLQAYARNLGLAFQIRDDLLDQESTSRVTGKDVNLDAAKTTFVDIAGVKKCRELHQSLMTVALKNLEPFGKAARHLVALTQIIRDRVS